jgi:hypothetical protein
MYDDEENEGPHIGQEIHLAAYVAVRSKKCKPGHRRFLKFATKTEKRGPAAAVIWENFGAKYGFSAGWKGVDNIVPPPQLMCAFTNYEDFNHNFPDWEILAFSQTRAAKHTHFVVLEVPEDSVVWCQDQVLLPRTAEVVASFEIA